MGDGFYIFFHGSSVGQTSYVPADVPVGLCEVISKSYFAGRASRLEQSNADMALFVELREHEGESYVCYSYVKNKCISSEGRTGQYLAITCMSKDAYYLPDQMLSLLKAVYNQMFVGSIIDEKGVWLVSGLRGSEAVPALERAIKTIREWVVGQNRQYYPYKRLKEDTHLKFVGYRDWGGQQFAVDTCNSYGAFKALCNDGRIYVSEEYLTTDKVIEKLHIEIRHQEDRIRELENPLPNPVNPVVDDCGVRELPEPSIHFPCDNVPVVIFLGPPSSGKSTALRRMIEYIHRELFGKRHFEVNRSLVYTDYYRDFCEGVEKELMSSHTIMMNTLYPYMVDVFKQNGGQEIHLLEIPGKVFFDTSKLDDEPYKQFPQYLDELRDMEREKIYIVMLDLDTGYHGGVTMRSDADMRMKYETKIINLYQTFVEKNCNSRLLLLYNKVDVSPYSMDPLCHYHDDNNYKLLFKDAKNNYPVLFKTCMKKFWFWSMNDFIFLPFCAGEFDENENEYKPSASINPQRLWEILLKQQSKLCRVILAKSKKLNNKTNKNRHDGR